jgi:PST family polysaccharide transporter
LSKPNTDVETCPPSESTEDREKSYGSILKSSSIVGGAEVFNYGISLLRVKAVAVLLGPTGIGLLGLYKNLQQSLSTLAGAGVSFSGVREIAKSEGDSGSETTARVAYTIRSVSLVLGLLGALVATTLARPLSLWVFEDHTQTLSVGLLGIAVCFSVIAGGQKALIQGFRRITDLGKIQVLSSLLSTLLALWLYTWLGQDGILPVLILTAFCNLCLNWYFSRKIELVATQLSLKEVFAEAKPLLGLGLAFMWALLLVTLVDLFITSFILRELGMDSVGIYQAAWATSGLFAGFILNAMSADFYPRLTASQSDHPEMVHLINEQTVIGVLLALPGILGTLAFAPWVITLLYSADFTEAAKLLPYLLLGVFGRIITWPLGFVFLAKGAKGHFAVIETVINITRVLLVIFLVKEWGLLGAAIAWPLNYLIYFCLMYPFTSRMINFSYQRKSSLLFIRVFILIAISFLSIHALPKFWNTSTALVIFAIGTIFSLRTLLELLGPEHRIVRLIHRLPFLGS